MTKSEFNTLFREYVRNSLSPTQHERDFISAVYNHLCNALGNNCIQIGSYPRFTAIKPVHDLDVLYIIGDMSQFNETPTQSLTNLEIKLKEYFQKNTSYRLAFKLQTHSVTISFMENGQEYFGVDVVPAYINGQNEFNLDMYDVPEIVEMGRRKRTGFYDQKHASNASVAWIKSDPRGYIKIASDINNINNDYRKTVKFIKKWKHNASENNENFKLKSFHLEQIIVDIFKQKPDITIFDAIFDFFYTLPKSIEQPQIPDRANSHIYIDFYLKDLTQNQKEMIIQARDCFLVKLESFNDTSKVSSLLEACEYTRKPDEKFIFDEGIPTLVDPNLNFKIIGRLRSMNGFREYAYLIGMPKGSRVNKNNNIKFDINTNDTGASLYKWKVRNDNSSPDPRGEITDHTTKRYPESTAYDGQHFVECYAILNNVCIAKHRIDVFI